MTEPPNKANVSPNNWPRYNSTYKGKSNKSTQRSKNSTNKSYTSKKKFYSTTRKSRTSSQQAKGSRTASKHLNNAKMLTTELHNTNPTPNKAANEPGHHAACVPLSSQGDLNRTPPAT